ALYRAADFSYEPRKLMSATSSPTSAVPGKTPAPRGLAGFFAKFAVLKNAQRELWLTFAIKFLMVGAYGLSNMTIKLWLSSDMGYGDSAALRIVGAWSLSMTAFTLLVGSLTDAIGLRKTFFLGTWVCAIARLVMGLAHHKGLAL